MKNKTGVMFILSLLLVSSFVIASESKRILQSDWLETEVGSSGDVLGAQVVEVESHADSDITIIEITLPVKNPQDFDNIEVIGKKSKQPLKQKRDAEWIKNDEDGNYGLRLHLKKVPRFEFQIRLIDNVNENE